MASAAVGTFLAYAGANADETVDVVVAARELRIGETIGPDDVDLVALEVDGSVRGLFGSVESITGRQVIAAVRAGEFLLASATAPARTGDETLELTIALPASRAVGHLSPGERVDVFSTWSGDVTELIAVDARVLDIRGATTGFGAGESVVVRLAVRDFAQIEALVHAQAAGDITMVRAAIGSSRQDVGRSYRPGSRSAEAVAAALAEDDR